MRASVRSLFPASYLNARLDRRRARRRTPPRGHRCHCEQCVRRPSYATDGGYERCWSVPSFGLRLFAREWLAILAPFAPRVLGPLGRGPRPPLDGPAWYRTCGPGALPPFDALELDALPPSPHAVSELLFRLDLDHELVTGAPWLRFEVDDVFPVVVWLRRGAADPGPAPRAAVDANGFAGRAR
jgi:hypothetical protein